MSALIPFALGPEQAFFAKAESSWNTFTAWDGTDAMAVLKTTMKAVQPRVVRDDTRKTLSALARRTERKTVEWTVDAYLCGSGTAGTAPDIAPFLNALLGTQTTVAGTSVAWTPSSSTLPGSLQLVRSTDVFQQTLNGACIDTMSIESSGGPIKVSMKGMAVWQSWMNEIIASGSAGNAELTAQTAAMALQVDTNCVGEVVGSDGTVDDGADNDGLRVTDVTGTTLTLDSNLDATHTNQRFRPWRPTCTTLGNESTDIVGALTIDGGELALKSWKIEIARNLAMHNSRFGYDRADYAHYLRRAVTLSLGVEYRRDMGFHYDDARRFNSGDLQIIAGSDSSGSGDQWVIDCNNIELDMPDIDLPEPEGDVAMLPFTGVALGSSGEDEISITCQ